MFSVNRYRFQYDGRLQRSLETGKPDLLAWIEACLFTKSAVMLMETFDRLSRKEKYVWDVSDKPLFLHYRADIAHR